MSDQLTKQPEIISILGSLKNSITEAKETSMAIKDKLRALHKYDMPVNTNEKSAKEPSSAMEEFNIQLDRMKELNSYLTDILSHLRELI